MDATEDTIEVWKPVAGSEKYYEVSSRGRVRTYLVRGFRYETMKTNKAPRILEPMESATGHLYTKIFGSSRKAMQPISSLVASAFLPPPEFPDIVYVSFMDGNKKNLRADNLRYRVKTEFPFKKVAQ